MLFGRIETILYNIVQFWYPMKKRGMLPDTVSQRVAASLRGKPYVLAALEEGYANHSQVARRLGAEFRAQGRPAGAEALRAAVRRFAQAHRSQHAAREATVRKLLRGSSLQMRTRQTVAVVDGEVSVPQIPRASRMYGSHGTTLIFDDEHFPLLEKTVREADVRLVSKGLTALIIVSPEKIEQVPGVVAFLSSTLSAHGVNLREFASSYRDTVLLLEPADALRAFSLLEPLLR